MFELMNRQRAKLRRNSSKGFTLIELIVVILIIAIIAVALAPQVVKYVKQARIATDQNNAGTIQSAIQTGYADYMANGGAALTSSAIVLIAEDGTISTTGADGKDTATTPKTLKDHILDVMTGGSDDGPQAKYGTISDSNPSSAADGNSFYAVLDKSGQVTMYYKAKNADVND